MCWHILLSLFPKELVSSAPHAFTFQFGMGWGGSHADKIPTRKNSVLNYQLFESSNPE